MTKIKFLVFKVISTAILGLSLIGCGGGSSSGEDTTPTELATNIGTFVDSPVEGLKYSTSTLSGFTDNQGRFKYKDGETITFKIGNLELGSATGGEIMTPLTLTGENDLDNISSKATNIARILQSLDENSSNSGLIKIPSSLKDLDFPDIDLESEADLNSALAKAQNITSKSYILKDSINTKNDMRLYIDLYNKYDTINVGTYSGVGIKYYLLQMPSSGNILTNITSATAFIYDLDLNPYKDEQGQYHFVGLKTLISGLYIIKIDYDSGGEITLNSSILYNQNNLDSISVGTYSGTGVKYYILNMPNDGNIIVDQDSTTSFIYDTSLNPVRHYNQQYYFDGTVTLSKNTYIIQVNYGLNGGKITLNSSVLN